LFHTVVILSYRADPDCILPQTARDFKRAESRRPSPPRQKAEPDSVRLRSDKADTDRRAY